MARLDKLSENQLLTRIKTARAAFDALRCTAQTFGSRSVQTYRIFSGNAVDLEVSNVGFNNRVVEVVFTPDDTSSGLGGVIDFDYTLSYNTSGNSVTTYDEALVPSGDGTSKWRIYLNGSDTNVPPYARFKFYFFTNASGTFTSTLL